MRERFFDVETPSGRMETFVTHPEPDGPFPAVIIYMDIRGVRDVGMRYRIATSFTRVPRRATGS